MRHFSLNERLLIIFKRKEARLTVGQLADQLLMSKSNLSRIENGKIMVSRENEKLLEEQFSIDFSLGIHMVEAMDLKVDYLIKLLIFYRLFDDYSKDKLEAIDNKTRRSIAFPYYILVKMFIYTVKNMENKFVDKYFDIFNDLLPLLNKKYQKIFYITKMNRFYLNGQYEEAVMTSNFIEKEFEKDALLDSYLFHLKASVYGCLGLQDDVISSVQKASDLAIITNNSARLLALNITKANCERLRENYLIALEYDYESYNYAQDKNVHIYDYALLRNIAWTNYLLGNYEEAINYYKIAEQINVDDDLCFLTALCSYRLGLRKQCEEYLIKGRRAKNVGVAFPYLIDWMELTLNKRYSKRAEQKLLYCLRKYEETMHVESKKNIYRLLVEHYDYHNNFIEAEKYANKLKVIR